MNQSQIKLLEKVCWTSMFILPILPLFLQFFVYNEYIWWLNVPFFVLTMEAVFICFVVDERTDVIPLKVFGIFGAALLFCAEASVMLVLQKLYLLLPQVMGTIKANALNIIYGTLILIGVILFMHLNYYLAKILAKKPKSVRRKRR